MNWYLLKTKPNGHSRASENLQQQGFKVFCPLIIKTSKKKNRFLNQTIPLFPGYLFMGSNIEPITWGSVNATRGVSRVVTLDGKYRPVNDDIIAGLKKRCDDNGIVHHISEIISGDRLKIEKGPFADFICTVHDIAENQRVWVLINLLQNQTKTEISLGDLSKIS